MRFRQSVGDFPLTVSLGDKVPAWGLSRWDGNAGLRFIPPDDEGFALRGDTRHLVYRGRRRSHRFTILSDGAFEYDVILNKEPESNVIVLPMEGAEHFDFFRQPDFIRDPLLAGSYAVYKKETLIGEGTGKLCHIHRPEIIDARGRRCWGDLAVFGNCLCITIPDQWLSQAKYPVVVDPTIGTTTVGSQTEWYNVDAEEYTPFYIETAIAVNRFTVPQTFDNTATAYVYAYDLFYYGRCKPVLYSDSNNDPMFRRSMNEGLFDIEVGAGKSAGWRSTSFKPNTSITGGSNIWFGLSCDFFYTSFDYGMICCRDYWEDYMVDIPDIYPHYHPRHEGHNYHDIKISMYFTYTPAQHYVRNITQGVTLTDTRTVSETFNRITKQTIKAGNTASRFEDVCRNCFETVRNTMLINRFPFFPRKILDRIKTVTENSVNRSLYRVCSEILNSNMVFKRIQGLSRFLTHYLGVADTKELTGVYSRSAWEHTAAGSDLKKAGAYSRDCVQTVHNTVSLKRCNDVLSVIQERIDVSAIHLLHGSLFRGCIDSVQTVDGATFSLGFLRTVIDNAMADAIGSFTVLLVRSPSDTVSGFLVSERLAEYIRTLEFRCENAAGTNHAGAFHRNAVETIQAAGAVFRGLFALVRLFSGMVIRDYILGRFLKAREELRLKSCISREIILDSTII